MLGEKTGHLTNLVEEIRNSLSEFEQLERDIKVRIKSIPKPNNNGNVFSYNLGCKLYDMACLAAVMSTKSRWLKKLL